MGASYCLAHVNVCSYALSVAGNLNVFGVIDSSVYHCSIKVC
jgi:hypothetical protein